MAQNTYLDEDELIPYVPEDEGLSPGPTEIGSLSENAQPTPREGSEGDPTRITVPRGDRFPMEDGDSTIAPDVPDFPSPVTAMGSSGAPSVFPGAPAVSPLDLSSQRIALPRRGFNPADTELDPYSESPTGDQTSALIQAILAMLQEG